MTTSQRVSCTEGSHELTKTRAFFEVDHCTLLLLRIIEVLATHAEALLSLTKFGHPRGTLANLCVPPAVSDYATMTKLGVIHMYLRVRVLEEQKPSPT